MSAAEGSGGAGGDRPQGLSKFIRKASRALKTRSASGQSTPATPGTPATESRNVAVPRSIPSRASTATPTPAPANVGGPLTERNPNSAASYLKNREDKARALFAKYGMTLDPKEWATPAIGRTEWVEKKIVMRVHRQCHRCQTTFGTDKTCNNCQHTRCKKCPRFPSKLPKDQRGFGLSTSKGLMAAEYDPMAGLAIDPNHKPGKGGAMPMVPLTMVRNGREAVRKHPAHRVRRTCHRCETLFKGQATQCEQCKHQRCPACPREPPKTKKWPNGYPGDQEETFPLAERSMKQPRTRYRWECHECQKVFIEHEKTCRGCNHDRCNDCPRKPPKKTKKELDPDAVRSVEERMRSMAVRSEGAGNGDGAGDEGRVGRGGAVAAAGA